LAAPSKNTLVDVILLALGSTPLRELGLDALRGVLASDPRLSILDGAVDLDPVWEVISSQPGFDVELAGPPLCYVKTLEERLGVAVRLPRSLADLTDSEVRLRGSRCRPAREEIERILRPIELARSREVPPVTASRRGPVPGKRLALIIAAGLALVASLVYLGTFIATHVQRAPTFATMDLAELSPDLPLVSARTWGGEVHAILSDTSWLRQPEATRRLQLEHSLERLAASRKVTVLIVKDESGRARATAQLFGRPPRVQVRFY
jgi:hypothetical protein